MRNYQNNFSLVLIGSWMQ